jgi:hypothetical protein
MIIAAAGGIGLGAYGYLILAPAWTAYGRNWERVTAAVLTLFVLAAFAGAGLAVGLVLVYFWDDILSVFGAGAIHPGSALALVRAAAGAP